MGKPTKRTPELVEEILRRVSEGETMTSVCRDKGLGVRTWHDWMDKDEELSARFARARSDGFDAIADKCVMIADDQNAEDIQRSKLQVETRLKLLAKWDPKRYGERMQHTGEGGGPIQVNFYIPSNGRD